MKAVLVAVVSALMAGTPCPASTEVLDALVGRVDGQAITLSEVWQEVEIRRLSGEPPSRWASPKGVLEGLARRRLLVAEARKLRIAVSAEQVSAAEDALMASCGGQATFWAGLGALGLTVDRLRDRTERELLQAEWLSLRREMTFVPESEIRRFYRAQSDVFGGEGRFAEVRDEVREYLVEKRFRKELEGWMSDQIALGRVEVLSLPTSESASPRSSHPIPGSP